MRKKTKHWQQIQVNAKKEQRRKEAIRKEQVRRDSRAELQKKVVLQESEQTRKDIVATARRIKGMPEEHMKKLSHNRRATDE